MMKNVKPGKAFTLMGLAATVALLLCFSFSSVVSARPFRLGKVRAKYGCATCHLDPKGGGKPNPFGEDYARFAIPAGEKVTDELKAADSDGDGFSNDQELKAGSNPGNPNSTP
jgi:hypothetical protein